MTTIMTDNNGNGLTMLDVYDYLGEEWSAKMQDCVRVGWRLGQAFMHVLDGDDYTKLTGSLHDPFFRDDEDSVVRALEFLLGA